MSERPKRNINQRARAVSFSTFESTNEFDSKEFTEKAIAKLEAFELENGMPDAEQLRFLAMSCKITVKKLQNWFNCRGTMKRSESLVHKTIIYSSDSEYSSDQPEESQSPIPKHSNEKAEVVDTKIHAEIRTNTDLVVRLREIIETIHEKLEHDEDVFNGIRENVFKSTLSYSPDIEIDLDNIPEALNALLSKPGIRLDQIPQIIANLLLVFRDSIATIQNYALWSLVENILLTKCGATSQLNSVDSLNQSIPPQTKSQTEESSSTLSNQDFPSALLPNQGESMEKKLKAKQFQDSSVHGPNELKSSVAAEYETTNQLNSSFHSQCSHSPNSNNSLSPKSDSRNEDLLSNCDDSSSARIHKRSRADSIIPLIKSGDSKKYRKMFADQYHNNSSKNIEINETNSTVGSPNDVEKSVSKEGLEHALMTNDCRAQRDKN